jgi:hypothetical protein
MILHLIANILLLFDKLTRTLVSHNILLIVVHFLNESGKAWIFFLQFRTSCLTFSISHNLVVLKFLTIQH